MLRQNRLLLQIGSRHQQNQHAELHRNRQLATEAAGPPGRWCYAGGGDWVDDGGGAGGGGGREDGL